MTALVSSELLKLRTTRSSIGLVLAVLVLSGVAAAATAASEASSRISDPAFQEDLPVTAGFATIFALLLGIVVVTAEFRHGTITPTFLVTPARTRVILSKGVAGATAGALMSALSLAVFYAVAAPWLAARGAELHLLEGKAPARMLGLVVAGALTGLLGVGIGAVVRVQVAAVVGVLVWFLIVEPLVGYLIDSIAAYLPGAAGDALVQSDFAADNEKRAVGLGRPRRVRGVRGGGARARRVPDRAARRRLGRWPRPSRRTRSSSSMSTRSPTAGTASRG